MITEEQIEAALSATIAAALPYLRNRISVYCGEADAVDAIEAVPAPCVRHYLGSHEGRLTTVDSISGPLSIGLLVFTATMTADGDERIGAYGAHRICRDLVLGLQGSNLGIADLEPLDYARKRHVRSLPGRTVYLLEFITHLEINRGGN